MAVRGGRFHPSFDCGRWEVASKRKRDEREQAPEGVPDPGCGRTPVRFRPDPSFGMPQLREPGCSAALDWPGFLPADDAGYALEAERALEQVGSILRRLQAARPEIARLRSETRLRLDGLRAA